MAHLKNEEGRYFRWLCDTVMISEGITARSYNQLARLLYYTDFAVILKLDTERVNDGLALRSDYEYEVGEVADVDVHKPCSVLEMLIAISQRIDYLMATDGDVDGSWFWFSQLIANLGLHEMTDDFFDAGKVLEIVNIWMSRRFEPNGIGSPFPLRNANFDQRNMTIWQQMNGWLAENNDFSIG